MAERAAEMMLNGMKSTVKRAVHEEHETAWPEAAN